MKAVVRFFRRWCCDAELAYTLAIGFATNSLVAPVSAAAATAGTDAQAMVDVLGRIAETPFVSGAAGGLVAALVHAGNIAQLDEDTPERRRRRFKDSWRYGMFSMTVGALCSHYLARAAVSITDGRVDWQDLVWLGFCIGAVAFEVAPSAISTIKALGPSAIRGTLTGLGPAIREGLRKWLFPERPS